MYHQYEEADPEEGPSLAELAAIDAEWPVIEAEMNVVDAEITVLTGPGHTTTDVEWRRLRAAERALLAAWLVFLAGRRPDTGKAVA